MCICEKLQSSKEVGKKIKWAPNQRKYIHQPVDIKRSKECPSFGWALKEKVKAQWAASGIMTAFFTLYIKVIKNNASYMYS